jgi:tetratricopeptide (TPR) repeat protein
MGDYEESRSVLERSIQIQPRLFFVHFHLGRTLFSLGNKKSAVAAFKNAIRLQSNFAPAHYLLGVSLCSQSHYAAGLRSFRKALALHTRDAKPDGPTDDFKDAIHKKIRDYERLLELEKELPDILQGKRKVADPRDRFLLARHCHVKKLYATSIRFWEPLCKHDKSKVEGYDILYCAACDAALAGSGQGTDADTLDEADRARLRKQAIDWLREELRNERKALRETNLKKLYESLRNLKYWRCDPDLAGVRDEAALARHPVDEQKHCRTFWNEFDKLLSGIRKRIASLTKS